MKLRISDDLALPIEAVTQGMISLQRSPFTRRQAASFLDFEAKQELDRRLRFIRMDALREMAAAGDESSALQLREELLDYREDLVEEVRRDAFERPLRAKPHRTVWGPQRARILLRDGRKCSLCARADLPLEVDHKLPISRGGSNEDANLWALCVPCNRNKGALTVEEYLSILIEGHV